MTTTNEWLFIEVTPRVITARALIEALRRSRAAGIDASLCGDDASRVALAACGPEPAVSSRAAHEWHRLTNALHDELRGVVGAQRVLVDECRSALHREREGASS
jgi:hypothetical protein